MINNLKFEILLIISLFLFAENLAPSELKKLLNKQRKARKKAEQESAQAAQAQVKRDQHNKSRQQGDGEPDTPQLDELVPEKLARCEDPLEQAVRFLRPLQTLAASLIETHLMAFEIYYRKGRTLLMLQSIKRARRVGASHPKLHSCLIRFYGWVADKRKDNELPQAVRFVLDRELPEGVDAAELNNSYLENSAGSLAAVLEGAKMLYHLNPADQRTALNLVVKTSKDPATTDADAKVCIWFRSSA